MNEYTFEDLDINTHESFKVTITDEMLLNFKEISGDINPMHIDSDYAKKHGFDSKIVYGMLTASFYSKLVGVYLPGKYCLLKSIETFFENPVYVGDILTIEGKVFEKDDRFKNVTIKAKITNQNGKKISKAKVLVGFYE